MKISSIKFLTLTAVFVPALSFAATFFCPEKIYCPPTHGITACKMTPGWQVSISPGNFVGGNYTFLSARGVNISAMQASSCMYQLNAGSGNGVVIGFQKYGVVPAAPGGNWTSITPQGGTTLWSCDSPNKSVECPLEAAPPISQ